MDGFDIDEAYADVKRAYARASRSPCTPRNHRMALEAAARELKTTPAMVDRLLWDALRRHRRKGRFYRL
jgi:hypothetical protein